MAVFFSDLELKEISAGLILEWQFSQRDRRNKLKILCLFGPSEADANVLSQMGRVEVFCRVFKQKRESSDEMMGGFQKN